ncbi:STAS/SEC14 domain-containing protein [Pleionea sp. CnH1-48]|uniref:STAS/SEC14 domain-containing protein n=1 Tax=Pleionea sp. CnH1-48 TaxID=2954494 RepID=UPI00209866A8|nr:STAS/SEC14 domain-containing protein [Pleionea sp. CnH1-48]MCO7223679.1 STAS/SEC14 domain-containing protein [Pleionea sp. CnH1-48]
MKTQKHGISVGIERADNNFMLTIKVIGKLTHDDYGIMVPLLESALQGVKNPRIKALIDAQELDGWELRAAWDDLKLGLKHGSEFSKIAIVGNQKWLELSTRVGAWFMSGEIEHFDEIDTAFNWLVK